MAEGKSRQVDDAEEPKQELHGSAYFFYYVVLFFAVWFGSHRFDQDGDGDFDPQDVQIWLANNGWLGEQYKQTAKEKAQARRRAAIRKRLLAAREAEQKRKAEEALKDGQDAGVFDRDGDGDVDLDDFIESQVEGEAQEERAMQDLMSGQVVPVFIIFECVFALAIWFVMAIVQSRKKGTDILVTHAGLDSFAEGMMDLRLANAECEDYRAQVWRWLTYQFTHVGASHVLMNIFLNLMLGVPLEGIHGWWRMAIMFNAGVLGGACCYFVSDAHVPVVGCSGGCYALIGIHIADIIMNWKQKKFRLPTVFMLSAFISIDVLSYALSTDDSSKSHAAHVGGAIAGLIIGVLVCKNTHVKDHEKVIAVVLAIVGATLTAFSLGWMGSQRDGPLNIWEAAAGENGWCWVRQVFSEAYDSYSWVCVRCGTQSCIDRWSQEEYVLPVSAANCDSKGFYYDGR